MNHLIVCVDCGGYTERLRALQEAHEHVIGIRPADMPLVDGFHPITIPENWLPLHLTQAPDDPMSYAARRGWWAFNRLVLAALPVLGLDPDFVLCVESDCVASQYRWKALMSDLAGRTEDCLATRIATRGTAPLNWYWEHPHTLPWMNYGHIGAIMRISRFGLRACTDAAEECREAFGEVCVASCVARAGGTIGQINDGITHLNCATMKADPAKVILNHSLINHPVKSNTFDVPFKRRGEKSH